MTRKRKKTKNNCFQRSEAQNKQNVQKYIKALLLIAYHSCRSGVGFKYETYHVIKNVRNGTYDAMSGA